MDSQAIRTPPEHWSIEYRAPARRAEADLIGRLFERLPTVLGLNLAVALATVVAFSGSVPQSVLGVWLLLMLLTLGLRYKTWREYRAARPDSKRVTLWARRFTLGAAATGAIWGLAGVLFYDPQSLPAQIFLPFILAGMVGGSITALTGHLPAYMAFCICALVPYALRLTAEGDLLHLVMASLVALYVIGMGVLGRAVSNSLIASVRLAVENQDLAAALREKSALLEATVSHVNQGVAVFESDGRLVAWNRRHRELHGYPVELYRRGANLREFLQHDLARAGGGARPAEIGDDDLRAMIQRPAPARFEQPGAGGRTLEVERNAMPGGGFVSTSTDITERKRAEARMLHLAQHDVLTGLPNRLLFHDRLGLAMARCRREGGLSAVMLVDLDKFKEVNDAFGHRAGDRALREVARRLRAALRESDTVARIGGDEFALILSDLPEADAAALIAGKIATELERPVELDDGRLAAERQPGHRTVSERWRERRAAAPECRSGDVPRQGGRRWLSPVCGHDQARVRSAAESATGPRPRDRPGRAHPRISASARPAVRADQRHRGVAALVASGLRTDRPGNTDRAGRDERSDRHDRRVGARAGLRGGGRLVVLQGEPSGSRSTSLRPSWRSRIWPSWSPGAWRRPASRRRDSSWS